MLIAAGTVGCGPGSGEGLNVAGRPLAEGSDLALEPTLASIQVNIFDPSCVVCHSGAAAPQGLRLDAASSFVNLVGVASTQDGSLLRVAPGNPDQSYLVRKLEGTASSGEQMPLGAPPIPQSTIDFVRQWISDGALPESSGPTDAAPVVVSMAPSPDTVSADFPAQITVGFDQEIDASTVNALSFSLWRSGGDGVFGDGDDVAVDAAASSLSATNFRLAIMDLDGVAPIEDFYQVRLHGSGANVILSVDGRALDGEFDGSFPSGDGTEGGDFVAEFEIRGLQATLDSIQTNVFIPTCAVAGCHSGPSGPNLPTGLDLSSADASFDNLVGVQSRQDPSVMRVQAGDANASYLIHKLEGTAAVGGRMPQGGPALDPDTIAVIRAWIDGGAGR